MPDGSGEAFPSQVELGDEFYKISTGEIYRYIGGNPVLPASWIDVRGRAIVAQLSSNESQKPSDTVPHVVTYNLQDVLVGASHTSGDSKVYVRNDGLYHLIVGGQVDRTGGGGVSHYADYWLRKNGADILNSGVRISLINASDTDVLIMNYAMNLVANDYIEVVQNVDDSSAGLGLNKFNALSGGPLIPSVILTLVRLSR